MSRGLGALVIVASALTLAASVAAESEVAIRRGPSNSPIEWTTIDRLVGKELLTSGNLAAKWAGRRSGLMTAHRGHLSTWTRFGGAPHEGPLVRVDIPNFVVLHWSKGEPASVGLSVVLDAATEALVLAFTEPRAEWVLPKHEGPAPDWEAAAARAAESIRPLCEGELAELSLDLSQVLSALWYHGMDPREAGQIIIRPRMVTSDWPPASKEYEPEKRRVLTKPYWLLETLGAVTRVRADRQPLYSSSRLLMIRDDDIQISLGSFLH